MSILFKGRAKGAAGIFNDYWGTRPEYYAT